MINISPCQVTGYGLRVTVNLFFLSPVTCHLSPDFAGDKIL